MEVLAIPLAGLLPGGRGTRVGLRPERLAGGVAVAPELLGEGNELVELPLLAGRGVHLPGRRLGRLLGLLLLLSAEEGPEELVRLDVGAALLLHRPLVPDADEPVPPPGFLLDGLLARRRQRAGGRPAAAGGLRAGPGG